jgi:ABC-type transporter lipoprotein component MlaA
MVRAAALLLLIAVTTGCAQPVLRRDWSGYDGPGAAAFHHETLPPPNFPDPLEPLNRSVWAVNHALIVGVAVPFGRVYRFLIPRYVRDRVRDFASNLVFPRNLVANLLQGEWSSAGDETARFAVNTTVGVAGLWDPATDWLGIEAAPEDFGQVFARWGWRPSTFVVLPIAGPSSIRDGVGLLPDAVLDPATYFFPAGPVLTFNEMSDSIEDYRRFTSSSFDSYDDARLVWNFVREERIERSDIRAKGDNTGAVQTLQAAFLGPRDPEFSSHLYQGTVAMPTTGRMLPYSYRMQPGPAPLIFLVPGLGAHRLSSSSVALAEMAFDRGFSVAIVSSPLNPEFIERGGSGPVPGHAPVDAHDLHVALDAVDRDLGARYPDRIESRVYLGYSLGAFHGFYIAAEEQDPKNALVRFDRYLLLDPPVRLIDGMKRLDAFYDVPLALPEPERAAEVRRILLKAVATARSALAARNGTARYDRFETTDLGGGTLTPSMELPFTNEEAKFLIGMAFRRSLQEILYASQERQDLGVLLTERRALRRLPPYTEIGDYSFTMYFYAFVLPYYRDRMGMLDSAEEMVAANDLHAIAEPLRGNPKLRVIANKNDFLTSDEDVAWLTTLVGPEYARFFPTGGHLGNLHRPEVQAEVMSAVEDFVRASPAP